MVGRLAEVGGNGLGGELRPEVIEGLIAKHLAPVAEGEQLHEPARSAPRPGVLGHGSLADDDAKAAKQLDPNALGGRVSDHPFPSLTEYPPRAQDAGLADVSLH